MDLSTISTVELRKLASKLKGALVALSILGGISLIILCLLQASLGAFIPILMLPLTFLPVIARLRVLHSIIKSRTATEDQ